MRRGKVEMLDCPPSCYLELKCVNNADVDV